MFVLLSFVWTEMPGNSGAENRNFSVRLVFLRVSWMILVGGDILGASERHILLSNIRCIFRDDFL